MDKPEWLQYRKSGIGGSESASVLGVNPYQTRRELALSKLGIIGEQPDNPAMERGRTMEPIISDLFTQRTGIELITSPVSLRHPEHQHMLASFDRVTTDGETVVEIKCPGLNVFGKSKREGLPISWLIQLQHYMAFPGIKRGIFVVFNAEKWEMLHFDQSPDPELQNQIIDITGEFWESLQRGEIPEDTPPAIDMPTVSPSNVVRIETRDFEQAAYELRQAQEILKEAEALEQQAKDRIIGLMGQATVAESDALRCYYQEQKGRVSFDQKKLAKDHPELDLSPYHKQGKPFKTFRAFFFRGE